MLRCLEMVSRGRIRALVFSRLRIQIFWREELEARRVMNDREFS